MYVKGNPVGAGDPSGNWSAQDLRNPLERMGNYLHGRGWNTNREIASARSSTERDVIDSNKLSKQNMDVATLEKIIQKRFGREVNLKNGNHQVMLENLFEHDNTRTGIMKRQGSYSKPRGKDTMRAAYFIIKDGEITEAGWGSTRASRHSRNYGNDLDDGIYPIHGETGSKSFRYSRVFRDKEQMEKYYKKNGEGRWNPEGDTSVPSKQSSILIHYPTRPGTPSGSGGLGCQLFEKYDSWSRKRYKTNNQWRKYQGTYYKIDMNSLYNEGD
jgi:hypothetical protein